MFATVIRGVLTKVWRWYNEEDVHYRENPIQRRRFSALDILLFLLLATSYH